MNQKHIKMRKDGINSWLGERRMRVKQIIGISQKQVELTKRILKAREFINDLPDDKTILICADDAHIHYMFRFTKLAEKNIFGFIDGYENKNVYDSFGDYKRYPVFSLEEPEWKQSECVLITASEDCSLGKELKEYGYEGKIFYLYEEKEVIPFFCIQNPILRKNGTFTNEIAKSVLREVCSLPEEYWFGMIERIDKINNILDKCGDGRILVYCVGGHTRCLFEYTDIKYKNVVAFADRKERSFCGVNVRNVTAENFEDIDYIIISSFGFQSEIERYLISIGMQDKIVKLYDMSDTGTFYEAPNVCAPDIPASFSCSRNGMSMANLYASVEWSSGSLSENSEYLVTYNLLKNQIIDEGVVHNKNEREVIEEKNYGEANRQTAIVIQGPVVYEDDFTFRTICWYSIVFPEAKIILSTWEEEKECSQFESFYKLPIDIVLSKPPQEKGVLNVNYQVKSSYAGIMRAKELEYRYVMKTRTDFRLYADDCISYLYTLTKMFPAKGISRKRIAVLQPFLDIAYYIPDYILFGDTEDMLNFWDTGTPYPNHTDGMNPEMLMFTRYIKSLGSYVDNPLENLKDYVDMLCREFIIVDPSVYKYYWKKYSYEGSVLYQVSTNRLTAADWFSRQVILEGE